MQILILNLSILFLLIGSHAATGSQSKAVYDLSSQWGVNYYEMHLQGVQEQFRWMCVKCVKLHNDHSKYCLDIEECTNSLKGNKDMYQFKELKQLKSKLLEELSRYKNLILLFFQRIENSYLESFTKLELEEIKIQALYNRIQTQHPLTLTEQEFATYQIKQDEKEVSLFREKLKQVCSRLQNLNSNIYSITLTLQTLEELKQETVKELLATNMNQTISTTGNLLNGIKCGRWKIIMDDMNMGRNPYYPYYQNFGPYEIGGGYYNPDEKKIGLWIDVEIVKTMFGLGYILHIGKYQNGMRIGQWEIKYPSGGGGYYVNGIKQGQWIYFYYAEGFKFKHIGKYQDGRKIGQWEKKNLNGETIDQSNYDVRQSGSYTF